MEKAWKEHSVSVKSGDVQKKDQRPASFLTDCFHAELCAIAAYTYRSLITEGISRELSDTFDRIAIDETEHFRLVGSLILSLGEDPVICTRVRASSASLDTSVEKKLLSSLTAMINAAIEEEYAEVDRYRLAMAHTDDRVIRTFLSKLIADEERHVRMLVTML